jgi:exonuclease III
MTINVNAASTFFKVSEGIRADVVCVQEISTAPVAVGELANRFRACGWRSAITPSFLTERSGLSSGVAVLFRSHLDHLQQYDYT